jgi:hypothetical protein
MKKPWSITTTLRNPERLRSFLIVLKQLEGQDWNLENQSKYQILLIKERVYGYGSTQFYNGLNQELLIPRLNKPLISNYFEPHKIFQIILTGTD